MIRLAHADDAPGLGRIAHAAYEQFTAAIGRVPAPALQDFPRDIAAGRVWAIGSPPLGFAVAFAKQDTWFLENVAIAPQAQGQGHGRALIAFVEAEGQRRGFGRIRLYTNAKMTSNLALYPMLGYTLTGRQVEDGFDRVYFEKRL